MLLTNAMITGFKREIHNKIFGFWGHIHITDTNINRDFELRPISVSAPYYAELNKYKNWFVGKTGAEMREKGAGRPTKKERREIDEFKDGDFNFDWYDEEPI